MKKKRRIMIREIFLNSIKATVRAVIIIIVNIRKILMILIE